MATRNGTPGNDTLRGTASADSLFGLGGNDSLLGLGGDDSLEGGIGSDRLFGGVGSDRLDGGDGDDTLRGDEGNDSLDGGTGSDRLFGGGGRDTLIGSTGNAVGEIDILTGGVGRDLFVLGDAARVFYDDRNRTTAGRGDYALVTDFNTNADVIQLKGTSDNYVLSALPAGLPAGTAIYLNKLGSEPDELIAIIQGSTSLSLDGDYFKFTAEFDLADLNGRNGFKINGVNVDDFSGRSVSNAGDVNGDGFDDIIIGARDADPNGQNGAGSSYVVFGSSGGFSANFNLSTLNGSNGFKINGINNGDGSGISVSNAGDVNGDSFDDIIIGADSASPNGQSRAGESYVVFGSSRGFSANFNLSDLNGSNGFKINGINGDDLSGFSVSSAGDINGDGFDDILIGSRYAEPNGQTNAGESYVIFGHDFIGSVTNAGTAGNDTLTGGATNDILVGGLGNDRLIGGLGIDVLIGGAGNDIISFGAIDRRSNGGSGVDTLRIDGRDNIDLTTISNNKLTAFEVIDITGTGNNSLAFTRLDLLDLSDTTNRLIVNGNAGDKVTSTGQGWAFGDPITLDSVLYRQYTAGAATLLVDADITQTIS